MDTSAPLLQGLCNMLAPLESIRTRNQRVVAAAAMTGNWVGGRFSCTKDQLQFETNRMNQLQQSQYLTLALPYDEIVDVRIGRMLRFFKTVDVSTTNSHYRFRATPGKTKALYAFLKDAGQSH